MQKGLTTKKIIAAVFAVLVIGGIGGVLMDRMVLPYLSTLPGFRSISGLNPQSPIVITRREEIRINEGINNVEVANRAKNSLATIYIHEREFGSPRFHLISQLTGIVVSHDGIIVSPLPDLKFGYLITVLTQGQAFRAEVLAEDNFSGLSFLKVAASNLPVIKQAPNTEVRSGERLLMVWSSGSPENPLLKSVIARSEPVAISDLSKIYTLQKPNAVLTTDSDFDSSTIGGVVLNRDSVLVGLLSKTGDGNFILRSEELKRVIDNFLDDKKIVWSKINVSYQILNREVAGLFGLPKKYGVLITSGSTPILAGDFIFQIDGRELSAEEDFQGTIMNQRPGSKIKMKLIRNQREIEIEVTL